MNANEKKRAGVLAGLLVVLAAVLAWQLWPASPGGSGTARPGAAASTPPAGKSNVSVSEAERLDVRLERLSGARQEPQESGRDPFRFRPAAPPPPPPAPPSPVGPGGGRGSDAGGGDGMQAPPPPPPPPPITLKFIGVVTKEPKAKIAVLSDGKFVFHGREGDIIEGRFRVVRIGEESVQMEYLDGRGRQTIRLSGS